jgi:hypothetical protein
MFQSTVVNPSPGHALQELAYDPKLELQSFETSQTTHPTKQHHNTEDLSLPMCKLFETAQKSEKPRYKLYYYLQ